MSEAAQTGPNCPFYGWHVAVCAVGHLTIAAHSLRFMASGGNQCALRLTSYTPCDLAIEGKPVDWRVCPAWAAVTWQPAGRR